MFRKSRSLLQTSRLAIFAALLKGNAAAQSSSQNTTEATESWLYIALAVTGLALVGAAIVWFRSKKAAAETNHAESGHYNKGNTANRRVDLPRQRSRPQRPQNIEAAYQHSSPVTVNDHNADSVVLKNFIENPSFARLPVSTFLVLKNSYSYEPLPYSDDEDLLTAIEETQDEGQEDAEMRGLSIRILAAFKTVNSVAALSQISLYDLSTHMRSKAVATLADFDHESVFEPIVLACGDPTREVKAAAARALFKLNFDRADAWVRIADGKDTSRLKQAARAAVEAGLVERSFERLTSLDDKVAYEAFALVALLVKAGETESIFDAIVSHKDENVKLALVHVMKVMMDDDAFQGLNDLVGLNILSAELTQKIQTVTENYAAVAV